MAGKFKGYTFTTEAITVVTPVAETLFMCLAEPNDYTNKFGGKLLFTEEALNSEVKFKVGKGKPQGGTFKDIINDLLDRAYDEYVGTGKKATKVDKLKENTDADDNPTGKTEISVGNQEQPRIVNADKTVNNDFDILVGNGSKIKAQLYLRPYVMQGKVGITAYLNSVQLIDIIEYGSGGDMFDDESDDVSVADDNNGDF